MNNSPHAPRWAFSPLYAYYILVALQFFALTLTASNGDIYVLSRAVTKPWLGYLSTIGALSILVFEFPTGIFADRHGRGLSVAIAFALRGLAQLVMAVALGPLWFAAAAVLGSVGYTFFSGAAEAWVFSRVPEVKSDARKLYAEAALWTGAAKLLGGALGAAFAAAQPRMPFIISGLLLIASSAAFALYDRSLGGHEPLNPTEERHSWIDEASQTATAVMADEGLAALTWTGVFFIVFCSVPLLYWQPFFYEQSASIPLLGGVYCGLIVATMAGNLTAKTSWLARFDSNAVFGAGMLLCGLMLAAAALLTQHLSLSAAAFLTYHFFLGIVGPYRGKLLNERIPDSRRAAMLSFVSLAESAGGMAAGLAAAVLVARLPISGVFLLALVPLLAAGITAFRLPRAGNVTRAAGSPVT